MWGKAWDEEEKQQLVSMLSQGLSAQKIAKILSRPYGSVRFQIRQLKAVGKISNKFRLWTAKEHKQLVEMLDSGMKYGAIAKKLYRTYDAVHGQAARIRKKRGYQPLPRLHKKGELGKWVKKLCIPGVPDSAVGNILGVHRATIKYARERNGIPPGCKMHARLKKPEDADISIEAKFLRLYAGVGRSDVEISKTLHRSKQTISRYRRLFGLHAIGSNKKEK